MITSYAPPTLASPVATLSKAAQLSRQLSDHREQQSEEDARRFPEQEFAWLREANLLGITLPGQALSFEQSVTAQQLHLLKLIGKGNLSVGRIYEGHINALLLIHLFGTAAQRERWYADVQHGQHLFGVWNTQAHDGVSIVAQGDGHYVLQGAKTFCSGARHVTRPIVPGKLIDEQGCENRGGRCAWFRWMRIRKRRSTRRSGSPWACTPA